MNTTAALPQIHADIIDVTDALRSFDQLVAQIEGAEVICIASEDAVDYRIAA